MDELKRAFTLQKNQTGNYTHEELSGNKEASCIDAGYSKDLRKEVYEYLYGE